MVDDLLFRISRAYSSLDAMRELDLSKVPPEVSITPAVKGFYWDFSGHLSDEQIHEIAFVLICHISHLRDHLIHWAKSNGQDHKKVDARIRSSEAIKIMRDLCNGDKHGYPLTQKTWTGRQPRAGKIRREMRLKTRPEKGSGIGLSIGPDGLPRVVGDGTAEVVIKSEITDENGNSLGDLYELSVSAMNDWEPLLTEWQLIS